MVAIPPPTPEIDPELEAMEHEHHTHVQSKEASQRGLMGLLHRITGKRGRGMGTPSTGKVARNPKSDARYVRRAMARSGVDPDPRRQPHARLGRAKAKTPQFILEAEQRTAVRRFLRKLKITSLTRECPEMKLVEHFGSVLALASASTEMMKQVRGLGPAKRKKIHDYLSSKNVPVNWKP